jgi:hypothetical protein
VGKQQRAVGGVARDAWAAGRETTKGIGGVRAAVPWEGQSQRGGHTCAVCGWAWDEEGNPRSSSDSFLCCGFVGLRARVKHFAAR